MILISYSLFGTNPAYVHGAYENIKVSQDIYPGSMLRFYVTDDVQGFEPKEDYVQIIRRPKAVGIQAMFYRMEPCSEDWDAVLWRDCDSLVNVREAACVADWLSRPEGVYVSLDHEYHRTAHYPLWGGMTGVKRGVLPDMKRYIDEVPRKYFTIKAGDMHWLREFIYPKVLNNIIRYCNPAHPAQLPWIPIPPHAPYEGFIGKQLWRNGI